MLVEISVYMREESQVGNVGSLFLGHDMKLGWVIVFLIHGLS